MERKLSKEELAQKAIELLDQAEDFEQRQEWYKAIENYQRAADYLQQSGYLTHRIQDIYTRATEINNYLKQQQAYDQSQFLVQQAQLDQLQDQAFAILDEAKRLEESGDLENSIQNYLTAIKTLSQAGWSESQLENLSSKIMSLAEIFESQKQYQADIQATIQPQVGETAVQPIVDQKAEALKTYEAKKKQEEDMQNQAFKYLDEGKKLEKDREYEKAIFIYQKAIEVLNSLGWVQQTQNIQLIVDKLKQESGFLEDIQAQQQQITTSFEESLKAEPVIPQSEIDHKKQKLIEFEEKKRKEEETQKKAFDLIDKGKGLERNRQYGDAIICFEQSINLLKSIGWDAYIQPVMNSIKDIKEIEEREIHAEQTKKKREEELTSLQKMIQEKQRDEFVETAQESRLRRREFEKIRQEKLQKEQQFFTILDEADKLVQGSKYDNAISEYRNALEMLKTMGSGWESYISTIEYTLTSIEQQKQKLIQRESEILREKEERKQKENEVQQKIAEDLRNERENLRQKELELKEREEEIKYREQRKQNAFKFLDAGQKYLNQYEFDKAIYAYQNAGNLFAEIQWTDELPLIENTIKEIEKKRDELNLLKQQKLKEDLARRKKEFEFQKQIGDQLNVEREKIMQRELIAAEQKQKLREYEDKRANSFKLLEEAEILMKNYQYEEALEGYLKADIILSDIQYPTNAIRDTIQKVRELKKEQDLQKQKEEELVQQKEEEDKEFQKRITENFTKEKERLREKEIELMKTEQRKALLEKKRAEGFSILTDAEDLTKDKKYDQALESYRKAELILNELHFPTESIKDMIAKVKNLKNERQEVGEIEIKREFEKLEEVKQLKALIEERKRQQSAERIAKQMAEEEKKRVIQEKMDAREAAYSLLEEAGHYLKRREPDFDKGISLHIQAKNILEDNIGWEPELSNLNRLIQDLQHEKAMFLEKRRLTDQAKFERHQEYVAFEQELKRRTEEYEKEEKIKRSELQEYEERKRMSQKYKDAALGLIDEGKNHARIGEFNKAYDSFNKAIIQFREMGWVDHIHYIETEINNTKTLEEKSTQEKAELERIHEELEKQVESEVQRREAEDRRIRENIADIGDLAEDVKKLIIERKEELISEEVKKGIITKMEAKDFSRNLGKMMKIKLELQTELQTAQEEDAKRQEELEKEKDRKELDDIKSMIKEAAKKEKE